MLKNETKKTACTRDCPDACGMIATVENGIVTRLQGDPDHPITKGFICHRTSRFLERQYSQNRLIRPLLRNGKGGRLVEISWPAALDLIAENLLSLREESGAASILQYRCGGSMGILKNVGDYFFERFGPVTTKSGDVCAGAGEAAQLTDFGESDCNDFFDIRNSKTIILWGKNVCVSSIHLIPELKRARRQGTKIILIDPVHHQTTSLADTFIQLKPGGDAALVFGMVRWLIDHDQIDSQASAYCDHLSEYLCIAKTKTVGQWASLADVAPDALCTLALAYADGPSAIFIGWGLQRRKFGSTTIRIIDGLAAVSGNLGIAGGGASFYFARRAAYDLSFANPDSAPRRIPEPMLGPGIFAAQDPPIRMAYVWAANPVAMLPESQTVADALRSREFTVVVDPFLTDTADCADLVLPTTTMLEESDFVGAYGHHYLAEVRPVTRPPDGVLSDYDIFRELSKRVGLAGEFDVDVTYWQNRLLHRIRQVGITKHDFENGFVRNPFANKVLFADRKFKTPSGKVNLLSSVPNELFEPRGPQLRLSAMSTSKAQSSQWPPESQTGVAEAIVHPDSAKGFSNGDIATLKTDHGEMQVQLKFDDRQRADMILLEKGGWCSAGRCPNVLIPANCTDNGEGAIYYDTPVKLI